jgi:hypothetical protein
MMLRLAALTVLALGCFTAPAFAPPPPPPPKWVPAKPKDLAAIPHMVGHWQKNIGRYCSEPFYPDTMNITAADAAHIVMNGQPLKITNVKVVPGRIDRYIGRASKRQPVGNPWPSILVPNRAPH